MTLSETILALDASYAVHVTREEWRELAGSHTPSGCRPTYYGHALYLKTETPVVSAPHHITDAEIDAALGVLP